MEERVLYLFGSINSESANKIIKDLISLDKKNNNDITIYINSNGGSVIDGLAICDVMKVIKSDIKTICVGNASSIAAVILSSGTIGKRFITKNFFVMVHEVSVDTSGKINDICLEIDHIKQINIAMKKILFENTKIDNLLSINSWYNSKMAIEYGIVDGILK